MEPVCLMYPALTGEFFTTSATWEARSPIALFYFIFLILMKMKQNQEYLHLNSHLQSSMSSFLKPVSFFAQGDTEADIYIFCVCVWGGGGLGAGL